MLRILTDRGTEYCGKAERHDYELYLAVNDIEHTKTRARSPQTNGICERFHKTMLQEFYQIAFRKKIYNTLDELQADLDTWLQQYNETRPHSGKYCFGKTGCTSETGYCLDGYDNDQDMCLDDKDADCGGVEGD